MPLDSLSKTFIPSVKSSLVPVEGRAETVARMARNSSKEICLVLRSSVVGRRLPMASSTPPLATWRVSCHCWLVGAQPKDRMAEPTWFQKMLPFPQGSRKCRCCTNRHGLIRKYHLNLCRQCFRENAMTLDSRSWIKLLPPDVSPAADF